MGIAPTTRANYLKTCAALRTAKPKLSITLFQRPMWVALDKKNHIAATWCRGYVQPFHEWRSAVRSLGYHPHKVLVVFPW